MDIEGCLNASHTCRLKHRKAAQIFGTAIGFVAGRFPTANNGLAARLSVPVMGGPNLRRNGPGSQRHRAAARYCPTFSVHPNQARRRRQIGKVKAFRHDHGVVRTALHRFGIHTVDDSDLWTRYNINLCTAKFEKGRYRGSPAQASAPSSQARTSLQIINILVTPLPQLPPVSLSQHRGAGCAEFGFKFEMPGGFPGAIQRQAE
ncbi:hypothetical protein FB451DRAFT_1185990 [Mycena latifolia]|nr:hypothetical protein FB451DRAFT_1185990 [Mycena latifolia]